MSRRVNQATDRPFATLQAALVAVMLSLAAGFVDAVAYLRHGVFAGNMTGNIVLLGLATLAEHRENISWRAAAVAAFLAGVVVSRFVRRADTSGAASLLLVAVILAITGLHTALPAIVAVCTLALAMGMQNAAMTSFGGVSLNTAFLTGDLQRLGQTVADPPPPDGRTRPAITIASAVVAYGVGAAAGAAAVGRLTTPLLLPAGVLLLTATFALARHRRRG